MIQYFIDSVATLYIMPVSMSSHPLDIYYFIYIFIYFFKYLYSYLLIDASVNLFIYPSIYSTINLFSHQFIYLFIYWSINFSIYYSIHESIYPSIYTYINIFNYLVSQALSEIFLVTQGWRSHWTLNWDSHPKFYKHASYSLPLKLWVLLINLDCLPNLKCPNFKPIIFSKQH